MVKPRDARRAAQSQLVRIEGVSLMHTVMVDTMKAAILAMGWAMLLPGALLTLGAVAFFAFPVAIAVLPFMLPTFFGQAVHEHRDEVAHRPPTLRVLHTRPQAH
jgi:hypothetical protein